MLRNLNILDLAVVKTLDLDFAQGMSVLTGETGAGKSILLTALGLALGDRADSGFVRPHCNRAEISLEFDLTDAPDARQWLQDNELSEDGSCLIRRIVNTDGRSKAYVNNRPVTLQALQELSEMLVEIHGQHAHLHLLNSDEQRRLLDVFGKHEALLEHVNDSYRQWQNLDRTLSALVKTAGDQSRREELLKFQLEELKQLDLTHFNYAALLEEHTHLANLGQIIDTGQLQLERLYDNDDYSANLVLSRCLNDLNHIAEFAPELNDICALLTEAQIQCEEAALQLRRFLEAQETDPQRLDVLEEEIGLIQNLSRKHHVLPEELPALAEKLAAELHAITHSAETIEILQKDLDRVQTHYQKLATELTTMRRQSANQLQRQISATIKELGMPHGEFIVDLETSDQFSPKVNGLDKITFLVSANPGLPPKPIAKVASGGELARISLAIQVTTANDKTTPTMIFDEVDSGIGGGIAEIVGQKLRALGQHRQVLCVTHLPQVAAQAHQHLYVEKNNQTDVTSSSVRLLANDERIEEIARMLGGVTITANTRAHAQEMLTIGNRTV